MTSNVPRPTAIVPNARPSKPDPRNPTLETRPPTLAVRRLEVGLHRRERRSDRLDERRRTIGAGFRIHVGARHLPHEEQRVDAPGREQLHVPPAGQVPEPVLRSRTHSQRLVRRPLENALSATRSSPLMPSHLHPSSPIFCYLICSRLRFYPRYNLAHFRVETLTLTLASHFLTPSHLISQSHLTLSQLNLTIEIHL